MTSTADIEESIAWDRIGLVELLNVIAKDWGIQLASLRALRPGASRSQRHHPDCQEAPVRPLSGPQSDKQAPQAPARVPATTRPSGARRSAAA